MTCILQFSFLIMRLIALVCGLLLAITSSPVIAQDTNSFAPIAQRGCNESAGAPIRLRHFGFCYLVGKRMRLGSVFAQCMDGVLTCYKDEGIPDKPREKVACVAPEAGKCNSNAAPRPPVNVTIAPSTNDRDRSADAVVNPSALVAGNLPLP